MPEPRKAALARVRDPETGEVIDEALALWFPGPQSETGEDVAELQLHGGRAVIAAVLAALGKLEGFRLAEPGEFTRRAFENGRLDLTQVEGLADLVEAETQAQRRQAFQQVSGLLGGHAETWRRQVIEALALVEAGIDFSDEADVPKDMVARALAIVRPLAAEIAQALAGAERGERLRDGLWVVIAGPPNAGKSTLLNRIARREAAIVSPHAGTTRDVIEVHLDLAGYPVNLIDTAGIRAASHDPIEREGMRRARAAAARANLVLWVVDAGEAVRWRNRGRARTSRSIPARAAGSSSTRWTWSVRRRCRKWNRASRAVPTSISCQRRAGRGLDALVASIRDLPPAFTPEPALVTRQRQHAILWEVTQALAGACGSFGTGKGGGRTGGRAAPSRGHWPRQADGEGGRGRNSRRNLPGFLCR